MNEYGLQLFDHHAAILRDSKISVEVARERGYRTAASRKELGSRGFGSYQQNVPALLIPIYDETGKVALHQARPDEPRVSKQTGKALKYETPGKARMVVDVPKRVRPVLGDPAVPLWITEGVRKADAAVTAGLACVALLGVWNWRGKNDQGVATALAFWESVALSGREVFIAYDSDVMTKRSVYDATVRLGALLGRRGARVRYVYLPSTDGAKVGLDDFLAAGGKIADLERDARTEPIAPESTEEPPTDAAARGESTITPEPPPHPLPERVVAALDRADGVSRNRDVSSVVWECGYAGLSHRQALSVVSAAFRQGFASEAEMVEDVARCWGKFVISEDGAQQARENQQVRAEKKATESGQHANSDKKSVATRLVELAESHFRILLGEDGNAYAVALDGPNLAIPFRGKLGLGLRLARLYYDTDSKAASSTARTDALAVLEGRAAELPREPVALRLARHDESIVLDLGTPDGRCVIIEPERWHIADRSPVLFRRTTLTGEMVTPVGGGDVEELGKLVNADKERIRLLVGWLVATLVPSIPHPILAAFGEQGTGKTTLVRLATMLVDPSPAPTRTSPKDITQWAVTAAGSWVVGLDNVSAIPEWLSDAMCRAITGDGLPTRALYSDSDISVIHFRRVVALNGIDAGALRGDLAERLLPLELERIGTADRKTEQEMDAAFADAAPQLLGAVLDLVAKVLAELPKVNTQDLPRMADFARLLHALDAVTGWTTVHDYAETADDVAETVLDADLFAIRVRALVTTNGRWHGTAAELLDRLSPTAGPLPQGWPKSPNATSGRLRRIVPALRQVGVAVTFDRGAPPKRERRITIEKCDVDDPGTTDRPSSTPSSTPDTGSDLGVSAPLDGVDDMDGPSHTPISVVSSDSSDQTSPPGGRPGPFSKNQEKGTSSTSSTASTQGSDQRKRVDDRGGRSLDDPGDIVHPRAPVEGTHRGPYSITDSSGRQHHYDGDCVCCGEPAEALWPDGLRSTCHGKPNRTHRAARRAKGDR